MDEQFELLFLALESRNAKQAEQRIQDITNIFLEDIEQTEADVYILTVFNRDSGLLSFIERAANKNFDKPISRALELVYTLIKDFPLLVRDYQLVIVKICTFIARVGNAWSKAKALETIEKIITTPKIDASVECVSKIWEILKEKLEDQSDVVFSKTMVIIGKLVKEKHEMMQETARQDLLDKFVERLPNYRSDKIIESCFNAVTELLHCTDLNDAQTSTLYGHIEKYCYYGYSFKKNYDEQTKKTANRAALNLLSKHVSLFSMKIHTNAERLDGLLRDWLKSENADNLKAGIAALDAFYLELADVLETNKRDSDKELLRKLIDCFEGEVRGKIMQGNVARVYIRALGYFAQAVSVHFESKEAANLFIVLKHQIEYRYELNQIDDLKDLENLPDYLFALASYISVLKEIDGNHQVSLQRVAILMVRLFPKLSSAHHSLAADTFVTTLHIIFNKCGSSKFEDFLKQVIEGCVKWTCSHYVAQEVEHLLEDSSKYYTYKMYMPFWLCVLKHSGSFKFSGSRISKDNRDVMIKLFVDELMKSLFTLVQKLNVDVKIRDGKSSLVEPGMLFEAVKPSDYNIFVNMGDLYVEILDSLEPQLFRKWVLPFLHHVMKNCMKHGLISGFYKLIAAGLRLCDRLDYFNEQRMKRQETHNCFQSIVKLIQSVLVKVRHFKDDLQIACIQVVLSAPVVVIENVNADFTDFFLSVFKLGRTIYTLADQGVATIERWNKVIPQDKMQPLLMRILPALDPILRSHAFLVKKGDPVAVTKSKKNFRKRRILVDTEPELTNLQRKILCLLAQMNSDICWEYVNANVQFSPVVWSETPHLCVPLSRDNVKLYLDKFVPRVLELALFCSDRKVRFTACELLHSITMVMLGTSLQIGDAISDLNEMLKKITSAILSLAVDSDTTISILFSPLINQMMHWYASSNQLGSKQTQIVLDILLDAISNPNDVKVRDMAGKSLKEFVNWSRRAKKNANNYNVGEILRKLKYFNTHPDSSKRLGAALIFNNIYAELREEDDFINLYWLELLYTFVVNLQVMHSRSNDDCLRQVNLALDNILRVLIERRALFDKPMDEEKLIVPPTFSGNAMKDIAEFLLKNTTSLSAHCRVKCMEMYSRILTLDFTGKDKLIESNPFVPEAYEHELKSITEISKCKTVDDVLKWLNSLRCLIDGHIFVLSKKMRMEGHLEDSKLFQHLDMYLKESMKTPLKDFNLEGAIVIEKYEEYEHMKKLLIEKYLQLAKVLLNNQMFNFGRSLSGFLCDCIFDLRSLGLQSYDANLLNRNIEEVIRGLPADLRVEFESQVRSYLTRKFREHQRGVLTGALFLQSSGLMDVSQFAKGSIRDICNGMIKCVDGADSVKVLPLAELECHDLRLQLALENAEEFLILIEYLCEIREVLDVENGELKRFGLHLYRTFNNTLAKFIIRPNNVELFVDKIFESMRVEDVHVFVSHLVLFVRQHMREVGDTVCGNVVRVLLSYWGKLDGYYSRYLDQYYMGLNLAEQLAYIGGRNDVILEWTLTLFRTRIDCNCGKEQQFDFLNQRVYMLGLLAGTEEDLRVQESLKNVKVSYSYLLDKPSNKTSITLLIKTYFEAAHCSNSSDILASALDLYVFKDNDYDPSEILKTYFQNTSSELQNDTLHIIRAAGIRCKYGYSNQVKLFQNLTILLVNCDYEIFEAFYVEFIEGIIQTLATPVREEESSFCDRIISCVLLEALFLRIDTDKVDENACPISLKVSAGKDLVKKVTSLMVYICKEKEPASANLLEIFRLYQCHAYNTFASMICNTQKTNSLMYTLLFMREEKEVDMLWCKLVGPKSSFDFDIRNNETFSYKDVIVKIRSEAGGAANKPYIESQNLFLSSLSEDIGRHDFTHAVIRTQTIQEDSGLRVPGHDYLHISLTNEDIDRHKCMATVCGIIKHMSDNNLLETHDDSVPKVVESLRKLLLRETTIANAKVFLVKAIEHSRRFLKDYAIWLIGPVMKVLSDGCAGDIINSFVVDVMELLLTGWSGVDILDEDKENVSKLLEFLMRNVYSEFTDVFKYNLRLLKLAVEKWKDDITVPCELILQKLENEPISSKKVQVVVHLINILIANGLEPWGQKMKPFTKSLFDILKSTHKVVYLQCAETIGLMLKYVTGNELYSGKSEKIIELLLVELKSISDLDKRANCLEGLSKHYPEICAEFISSVIDSATNSNISCTTVFLRILLRCPNRQVFNRNELLQLLSNSNTEVQTLTLEIIKNSVEAADVQLLLPVVKKVCKILSSKNVLCRSGMYDVLIAIYKKFSSSNQDDCLELISLSKDILLQGLIDTNVEIQEKVFNFWLSIDELPCEMDARFIYLLQNLYKPSIEELYLGYSTMIMLSNLRTDLTGKIFNNPLHKCQFSPVELSSHWRAQYSSLVPLFTSSLSSQADLRATQTLQFEPTVTNTLSTERASLIEGTSSLFTGNKNNFKNPNEYNISQKYKVYKKRFNKNKQDTQKYHAMQNIKKRFSEKSDMVEAAKKRDSNIQVFRKYRVGDYPDIEIARLDLLKPLQELSKNDPQMARILFTMMFDSVKASSQRENFISDTAKAIDSILRNSTSCSAPVIAAMLDIAVVNKKDMRLDPRVVSSVCLNSRLMSLGATLLEEYLIASEEDEGPSKRIKGVTVDYEGILWIQIAGLYKEMEDWDVVRTIFLEKLKCSEKTLEAIEAEATGMWKIAKNLYERVICEDTDPDRRDFYYESIFRCFSELSSWSELTQHIESVVSTDDPWNALWEDEWNKQKLLPVYLTAKIREIVEKPQNKNDFMLKINADIRDGLRSGYLKDNHSEQLAFLGVLQDDLIHSKTFLDSFITNFVQNWSCINPLFSMLRGRKLISMRNTMDIYLFIKSFKNDNLETVVGDFCRFWERSAEERDVSIVETETRNLYRKEFAKLLKGKAGIEQLGAIQDTLDTTMFNLDLMLIENALQRSNFYVVKKYIATKMGIAKRPELGLKYIACNLLLSKFYNLNAKLTEGGKPEDVLKKLQASLQSADLCLKNDLIKSDPALVLNTASHIFAVTTHFYNASKDVQDVQHLNPILTKMKFSSSEDVRKYGEDTLSTVLMEYETFSGVKSPQLLKTIANCYYKLATHTSGEGVEHEAIFIQYTLKAMFYESQEAIKLFPCLLNMDGLASAHKDSFIEESSRIPVWMFIKWIPQLLAYLDSDKVSCISGIINNLAAQYPNSIIYAYNLSKEHYKFEHELHERSRDICNRLDEILDNPLVDQILTALSSVCKPHIIIRTALDSLKKSATVSEEAFKKRGNDIMQDLYNNDYNRDSIRGVHYKYVQGFKEKIKKLLTGPFKEAKVLSDIKKLFDANVSAAKSTNKVEHEDLVRYSPWLKNFSAGNFEQELEIPGQYTGDSRPLLQYHVKLAGFDPDVMILASKRKPIRITMLGSDTKEYKFLVKYGEDLRQDARIEQMFKLMNNILHDNPECNRQKLRVITFEVIPLNSSIGLIEWVDDTKVLKDFVMTSVPEREQRQIASLIGDYHSWIEKSVSGKKEPPVPVVYANAALKYNKVKTVSYYKSLTNQVPWDALRSSFFKISVDLENLFALKERFIKSYSVMCVSNWLLGIGDRHLSNTLVSLRTGEVVGIDFGLAFGTATQELPVPELVPFRLTPQIVNLTLPHGVSGILKETMIHSLRVLRENKEMLLSTMDVFIQEPTMDWLEATETVDEVWYPLQKIGAARSKFEGANPCEVMMDEVKKRSKDPKNLTEKYLEYLKGNAQDNFRAQAGGNLSPEEQVKCLLDQATDANLLGRMYTGWEPWI